MTPEKYAQGFRNKLATYIYPRTRTEAFGDTLKQLYPMPSERISPGLIVGVVSLIAFIIFLFVV